MQHHSARHADLKAVNQTLLKLAACWSDVHDALREDSLGCVRDFLAAYLAIAAERKLERPVTSRVHQIFGPSGLRTHPGFQPVPSLVYLDAILEIEADDAQKAILQRWRNAVVEDAAHAMHKMDCIQQQHFQAAQPLTQPSVQAGAEDDRALQAAVEQSKRRRPAKQRRSPLQRPADQQIAPIAIRDDDQSVSNLQLGVDKTGLKTVPKQKARANPPDPTKMKLRALQLEVETEQETAIQQLVQVQSSSAKSTAAQTPPGTSRAVAALCEEIGLTPRAKKSLGATSLQDFQYISFANLEDAAGRTLTIVERNRLSMTLAAEGVQLLGENGRLARASRQQFVKCEPRQSTSSLQFAAPSVDRKHDSVLTQVSDLAPEQLQIAQWRGSSSALPIQNVACSSLSRACAHAVAKHAADEGYELPYSEGVAAANGGLQLAWTTPPNGRHCNVRQCIASPADVEG
eukprot:6469465-Amphidinium_carterae.2